MRPTEGIRTYDQTATALAFPLGGIGTGNISLGARGDLRDWEIFNNPNKGKVLPNTFFAIRTQTASGEAVARVLEGPVQPPYNLSHGFHPSTSIGFPRMINAKFRGEYPFATIDFEEPDLPLSVHLEAFTPLIPLNPNDSGIPCAIFTYTVTNTSDEPVNMTIVGSVMNPVGDAPVDIFGNPRTNAATINHFTTGDGFKGVYMSADNFEADNLDFGNLSIVTDHANVTTKPTWLRSGWWDYMQEFWDDFTEDGLLNDLGYDTPSSERSDTGSLGVVDTLEPGATKSYRFIISWYFPNRVNHWEAAKALGNTRNFYATLFDSSWDVASYVISNYARLDGDTRKFHDALFGSTLPPMVLDALSANIVPVRSTTCFWLEDGRFYGWEGCFDKAGCCTGNCTHVWSYVYTVAYLFPSLEREMRKIEFNVETDDTGYMAFRSFKTFDPNYVWAWNSGQLAALDGQMGCIIRAYREWQLSADKEWLSSIWPAIKLSIDYASSHWDTDGDGVPDGKQHNTYDIEFYGPNPLCTIYYLAALRAVEELAKIMGEPELAPRCRAAFEKASQKFEQVSWNGEFYIQVIEDVNAYKYQHGVGCLSDQLLGQLHARALGLGDLLPVEHVRTAIKSVFDYNFRSDFTEHVNAQRVYAINDEEGLILCSWPEGGRPRFPFPYSEEVWTGIEYHVAAHLIYEGWVEEGLKVVEALRERHEGVRRNPWNEVECGHHYARSMSSWTVLLALTGTASDLSIGELRFEPREEMLAGVSEFETFWSSGKAWGIYKQSKDDSGLWQPSVAVLGGSLDGVRVIACGREVSV